MASVGRRPKQLATRLTLSVPEVKMRVLIAGKTLFNRRLRLSIPVLINMIEPDTVDT